MRVLDMAWAPGQGPAGEERCFIQVVAGPRQVGKTTMVREVVESARVPVRFASADEPSLRGEGWVAQQWEAARLEAGAGTGVLVIDEVQKAAGCRGLRVGPGRVRLPRWLSGAALLRRVFELGCRYSGQILSYTKMLGQLHDAGNTTTLAHYLDLLTRAGMVTGLQKYAGEAVRQRASSPKLQAFNPALVSAQSGYRLEEARADTAWWGRLVESAVGAHLVNGMPAGAGAVHYWRNRGEEVDFVVKHRRQLTAIEVKSTAAAAPRSGLEAFRRAFGADCLLMVGGTGFRSRSFCATRRCSG